MHFCSTPQINSWTSDWIKFYAEHRLGYQLKLARQQYGDSTIYERGKLILVEVGTLIVGQDYLYKLVQDTCPMIMKHHKLAIFQSDLSFCLL